MFCFLIVCSIVFEPVEYLRKRFGRKKDGGGGNGARGSLDKDE